MARIITDYLENSSAQYPNKVAFIDGDVKLTFKQLRNNALHVAKQIIDLGFFKKPIVVFMDKGIECIASFLGTAYSGNFYSVIDTTMPDQRIEKIFDNLMPCAVITNSKLTARIVKLKPDLAIIDYDNALCMELDEQQVLDVTKRVVDSDVLYVLYTSGSTGVPKGVITSHCAVIGYIEAVTKVYKMDNNTVIGNQAPFYFVVSLIDIYCTIKNSGTTHLLPKLYFAFPIKLVKYIERYQINFINWVCSALAIVASSKALKKADLSCLKTILFSGEVMPIKHLNAWIDVLPNTVFVNGYGSTEVTDGATYYIVNRKFKETDLLPLGVPFNNTSIFILNDQNELANADEKGELCVRGNNLAYGYYNDQERTNKVFIQNPINTNYREIIYRTGDIVKFNEYGEIEYIGRKDFQIRHMGRRIELGEIEVNVSSIEGIDENCCFYDAEHKKIILVYTGVIKEEDLGDKLRELLPVYMLPNERISLSAMPHNLNGKIDREKLKNEINIT